MPKDSRKSKRKQVEWSDWGKWIWSEQYQKHYRQRQNTEGVIDTYWAETEAYETREAEGNHPQEAYDEVEGIADQLAQASISPVDDTVEYGEPTGSSSSNPSYSSKHSSSRSKGKGRSGEKSSKGKSRTFSDEGQQDANNPLGPFNSAMHGRQHYPSYASSGGRTAYPTYGSSAKHEPETDEDPPPPGSEEPEYEEGDEYGPQSFEEQTQDDGAYNEAGGEDDAVGREALASQWETDLSSAGPSTGTYSPYSVNYGQQEEQSYDYDRDGARTPRAPQEDHVTGRGGTDYEELDPRFRVEPSHKFKVGEVFKVLWPEPHGATAGGTISERREIYDARGSKFYVGFRRFIIVANDSGHCTCVPILTYGGRGCKKKGVKPDKHGIIAQEGRSARLLDGEKSLGYHSVKMRIEADGEKLAKESRVNYSKLVTVEHNVKVFFIGGIVPNDWIIVSEAVNDCWDKKDRDQRRSRHH